MAAFPRLVRVRLAGTTVKLSVSAHGGPCRGPLPSLHAVSPLSSLPRAPTLHTAVRRYGTCGLRTGANGQHGPGFLAGGILRAVAVAVASTSTVLMSMVHLLHLGTLPKQCHVAPPGQVCTGSRPAFSAVEKVPTAEEHLFCGGEISPRARYSDPLLQVSN